MVHKVSHTQKVLNVWAIILIIWSVYRAKLSLPAWIDELVAKPFVFILPVIIFLNRFEGKKEVRKELGFTTKNFFSDIRLALIIGLFFSIIAVLSNFIKFGNFSFTQTLFAMGGTRLFFAFVLALATGVSEEVLSRGFVLNQFYKESGNPISASFLSSIFFLILHVPILFTNLKLSGTVLLFFLATDFILSLVNSFVFLDRKSLTAPILIHAFYNMSIILYIS